MRGPSKADLEERIRELERRLELAERDYDEIIDVHEKLRRRQILIKIMRGGELMDAALIPSSGKMSASVWAHPDDEYLGAEAELYTEVVE